MKIIQVISHEAMGVHQTLITFDVNGPNGLPIVANSVGGTKEDFTKWVKEHAPEARIIE